ncbi:MAG: hypothetical protein PHX04_00620 [Bacilli bacterium]|nr:hypothetical protein [Bacilli bacterium]
MRIKLNYLKAIVFVHGKSELQIFNFIRSRLRLKIDVVSKKKGECSIQITSVMNILNNAVFKNQKSFLQKYPDVEIDK